MPEQPSDDTRDRDGQLRVVDPATLSGPPVRPSPAIHGVVLAAGTSERYGYRNKLLERIDGEPLVRRATEPLTAANLATVTVVVGHQARRVRAAVADMGVDIVENDDFRAGQSTAVRTGVARTRERGDDAVLVALGDMPAVSADAVERVLAAYRHGVGDAVVAAYDGVRGNPVLFDARYYDALSAVEGDSGGKAVLLGAADGVAVETGDPGVVADVDRPADRDR
jgi:molybdenum cofactor cytidylyltransferase